MSSTVPATRSRGRRIAPVLLAGLLLVGSTGAADAATVYNNTTTLYACVNKVTKAVRIVIPRNGHSVCPTRERTVSWLKVGAKGPMGPMGPQGLKGDPGAAGTNGTNGTNGLDGAKGDKGDPGTNGLDGAKGDPGTNGLDGAKGDKGDPGTNGLDGAKGDKGDPGTNGLDGAKGDKGDPGTNGLDGAKGDKGDPGTNGLDGAKGDKGDPGTNGLDGAKGDKGDPGVKGDKGDPGVAGPGLGGTTIRHSAVTTNPKATLSDTASVTCNAGETMVGGGGVLTTTGSPQDVHLTASWPSASNTWSVSGAASLKGTDTWTIQAYAICAG